MADAVQCLESLHNMLRVRRQEAMEKMARGMEKDDSHREQVGRCKALADTMEQIEKQIRNINGGKDDETSSGSK